MAVKYLHQDSQESTSSDKPLLRNWCKEQVKAGNEPYEKSLVVRCLKESKSGEWLIAELDECSTLIPAKSEIGKNLLDLMPKLKGEGNALVVIPHKKGKLGFSVGLDDEFRVYYKWDEDEEYLWITNKHIPQKSKPPAITLEAVLGQTSPQTSESAGKRKKPPKPDPEALESGPNSAPEDTIGLFEE